MDQQVLKEEHKRDLVFISYSHKDKRWLERLLVFLKPYLRQELIQAWDDTKIRPGTKWKEEIKKALASAKAAVLIVSQEFLASDYIANEEFPGILNAARKEGLTILWIAVGDSSWRRTLIADYQAINNPTMPLNRLNRAKRDQELLNICEKIVSAANLPPLKSGRGSRKSTVRVDTTSTAQKEEGEATLIEKAHKVVQASNTERSGPSASANRPDISAQMDDQKQSLPINGSLSTVGTWVYSREDRKNEELREPLNMNQEAILVKQESQTAQEKLLLAGYIFVEKDGQEQILVRADARLPIIKVCTPYENTIEWSINEAIIELFIHLGITVDRVLETGFSKPQYRQLYKIDRPTQTLERRPCIFFKLGLKDTIQGTTAAWEKDYRWEPKDKISREWQHPHFSYGEGDKEEAHSKFIDDPYQAINNDWVSFELGLKVLECVDMLIFRKNEKGKIEFLVIRRRDEGGWEYPKGALYYHETPLEGAFREIKEETGIEASRLHYCGNLGWQTVNVRERRRFYDTLRVQGLTFYYVGNSEKIVLDHSHTSYAWHSFNEAMDSLWIAYGPEFFRRWKDRRPELLRMAGIVDDRD